MCIRDRDTEAPYSFDWNDAPIGTHTIMAKATDNDGEFALSLSVQIMVTTTGGQLTGTVSTPATNYDLTAQNSSDWAVWGCQGVYANTQWKALGGGQISALSPFGDNAFASSVDTTNALVSWNDGMPAASAVDEAGYIYNSGAYITVDSGWTFSVPADATPRTLYLLGGGGGGGRATPEITLTAHLSDGSAPDFVDLHAGSVDPYWSLYTLNYKAGAPNQTLMVTLMKTDGVQGGSRVNLKAAWLIGPMMLAVQSIGVNGANLEITFSTPDPAATHTIEQAASLAAPVWSGVSGVAFAAGPNNTRVATFPKPADSVVFYRIVKQ